MNPASLARRHDPATSHHAAERARIFAPTHELAILAALRELGPMGASKIAKVCGWKSNVIVCRRLAAMRKVGQVQDNGTRTVNAAGNPEKVWRAA